MKEYTKEEMEHMHRMMNGESAWDRMKRKSREEPLVPAGVALTCFALVAATVGVKTGNKAYANNMFRLRVAAQGFTIVAMVGGSLYYTYKEQKQKEALAQLQERSKTEPTKKDA
ncbi:hypoxia induced protein conserved region-domain-containing protein [Halteromyces radiatus]|uniref:hypoxia induced protein conserved region-domain-containing protein n=1 Tax=Halteromyces radiatus TaxID=101107 RepID=UPI002220ED39|nr:hypoxia induced protein conserved region-domain-containing protein [Halteromyces radiatus]KAI8092699.1 hypoxia induced protein conserved region-domain-containing protein [Halteromyces radiatus]